MGNILKGITWCEACLASHRGRSCEEYREYILRLKTSLGKSHVAKEKTIEKITRLPTKGNDLVVIVEPSGVRLVFHTSSGQDCSISISNFINSGAFNGDVVRVIEEWSNDRIRGAHAQKD